ncbi:MAG: tRNA 2-thiouridine(34) synthase MnmA [Marinirhabdus sp.]
MKKRAVVGLSGGVDSSVAAYLLKKEGFDVIGLFMKNWHDGTVTASGECPWLEDSNDAMLVAEKLGIPFQTVDLSEQYSARIVDYMFREYKMGRTPNPDVLCNREIKFDVFMKIALNLGAHFVATGHYCQKKTTKDAAGNKTHHLLSGKDPNKDQSYFLCQLSQAQLAKTRFPIGGLLKREVRKIAKEQNLITAEKRDSQGLCFIGKVRLPEFLQQRLAPKEGPIVEVPKTFEGYKNNTQAPPGTAAGLSALATAARYTKNSGTVVGKHRGAHYFTNGQRKGLNVGGTPEPLFVIHTDVEENIIYTGQGKDHPGLYRRGLFVKNEEIHWVRPDLALAETQTKPVLARIRYRQPLDKATLHQTGSGLYVIFDNPQTAIAKGQFVAWYGGDELLGSGVIS